MSKINKLKERLIHVKDDEDLTRLILNFFNKDFSNQDYLHLFRQERWKLGIYCPYCHSRNIKKPSLSSTTKSGTIKYLCLDCNSTFEDDTGTPLSGSGIPLSIWIQCWYLSQYCNSIQLIAERLNLDLNTVINMLHNMQHLFIAEESFLSTNKGLDRNNGKGIYSQKLHLEEESKKKLLLHGDTSKQPTDTAEYRRQKSRNDHKFNDKKPKV